MKEGVKKIPWDSAVFGLDAYEITDPSPDTLRLAAQTPGHYTLRLPPLSSKRLPHEHGFYYCDTLVEPYCRAESFTGADTPDVRISWTLPLAPLLEICHGAFSHGRFHRDFNLPRRLADQRYDNWLIQLHAAGQVCGLFYLDELAGFIAVDGNRLALHAVAPSHRGKGLAKMLWTPVCRHLFGQGHEEIVSSISAGNLAAVNLYASLGFRFRNAVDLYHRLTL